MPTHYFSHILQKANELEEPSKDSLLHPTHHFALQMHCACKQLQCPPFDPDWAHLDTAPFRLGRDGFLGRMCRMDRMRVGFVRLRTIL